MCGLEHRVAGEVVDVSARRDPDATHLRRERIRQVVAVQVGRGDDVELLRSREHLLERDVRDRVLDQGPRPRLSLWDPAPRPAVDLLRAEEALGDLIAPVAEGALGELHDVALVHQRDALPLALDGVGDRAVDEPLAAEVADRFEPHPHLDVDLAAGRADRLEPLLPLPRGLRGAEPDFLELLRELLGEEVEHLLRLGRARRILDARVDVFGVLAEDDHVDLLRMLHRARHAFEPAHRAKAYVEIQHLPQRHVERPDPSSDRGRQRSLDSDQVLAEGLHRLIRKPGVEQVLRLLAGVNLHPRDAPLAAVGLLHRRVEDPLRSAPDVRSGSIALDEGQDGLLRDLQPPVAQRDGLTAGRDLRSRARHGGPFAGTFRGRDDTRSPEAGRRQVGPCRARSR